MANYFDQFDAAKPGGNFFDQFDPKKPEPKAPERSWTEAAADTGLGLVKGVVGVAKLLPMGVGLADTVISKAFGLEEPASGGALANPVTRGLSDVQDYLQSKKSAYIQQKEQVSQQDAEAVGQRYADDFVVGGVPVGRIAAEFAVKFGNAVTDPALLVQGVSENVATVTPAGIAGRLTQRGAEAVIPAVAKTLTKEAVETTARTAGVAGGVTFGAVQQGSDVAGETYDKVMKLKDEVWANNPRYVELSQEIGPDKAKDRIAGELATEAGVKAGIESLVVNAAGAKFGGATFESMFLKPVTAAEAGAGKGVVAGSTAKGFAKGAFGEAITEASEEGYGAYAGNQALAQVDPSTDLYKGVGAAAGQGAATAFAMGGVVGTREGLAEGLISRQRAAIAEQQLAAAKSAGEAAAAANEMAGSLDELTASVDALNGVASAQRAGAAAPAERPTLQQLQQRIDREVELRAQAENAGTDFERRMALEQIQATRPDAPPRQASSFVELQPLSEIQATQRLAILRDEAAQSGGSALGLEVVPHPSVPNRFAIAQRALPSLDLAPAPAAPVTQAEATNRLEAAAQQGQSDVRRSFFQPYEAVTDQLQRGIEANEGSIPAPGAAVLDNAQVGVPANKTGTGITPYDTVTGTVPENRIIVPTTPVDQLSEQKRQASLQATNNESMAEQEARGVANKQQSERELQAQIEQTSQPAAAPSTADVISAVKTPGPQRTAEQVLTLRQAQARYSAADFSLLQRAATAPFTLNNQERGRLRELAAGPAPAVAPEQQTRESPNLIGERVARALGLPSNGVVVTSNAKLSTTRNGPGGTLSINDSGEQHTATIVDPSKLGNTGRLLTQIARIFGKRLVVFTSDTLKADGFVLDGNDRDIHINANSQMSPLAVFGHELMHLLKRQHPEAYAAVEAVIKQQLTPEQMAAFEADYGQGANLEELASDLMGNRFQEPQFWTDVFNEIARQNPTGAAGIIARVGAALNRAISAFVKAVSNAQGFKADEILGDVTAVRAALQTALTQYAKQQRNPAIAMEAQQARETPAPAPAPAEPAPQPTPLQAEGNRLREAARRARQEMGESITASRRRADFTNPEERQEVSTTRPVPAPKKGRTGTSYDEKWVIDGQDVRASQKHIDAILRALRQYNTLSGKGSAEKMMRELHDVVVDNLLWLHDLVPENVRARAKLWYDGANRIANDWTDKYGVALRQSSGVLAVLSPQMDWFKNVSLGERVITIWKNRQNETWSPAMTAWLESWVNASKDVDTKASRQAILEEARPLQGMKLSEMTDRQAALFIRAFDETYHERQYRLVTPEGGFGDYVTNSDDGDASVTWGGFDTIEKAVSILNDGSFRNIDERLGDEHKVRNFYNNIINPGSADGHVTIDTHAVAAALVKALSGSSREVADNFGSAGQNAETGASGTYGLFADAYRDAAAKRGILPREMQSITWEAVRALFPASIKDQLAPQVDAVWNRFRAGELTRDQAREEVRKLAGGIRPMAWEGSDAGSFAKDGGTSFNDQIPEAVDQRQARTLPPEVAKDKIQVNLSANTSTIPGVAALQAEAAKGNMLAHRLLQDIALDNLRHLLAGTSARVKADGVTGLYGGYLESGLSMSVSFADNDRQAVLAALAKFADNFNQEQVHVRRGVKAKAGTTFDDGSYATPVYRWELNKALTRKQIEKVIAESGLFGLTFADDFVEAYYVGDPSNETTRKEFDEAIDRADRLLGRAAEGVGRSVARLWTYGDSERGLGFDRVSGDVPAGTGVSSETAKRVAAYLNAVKGKDGKPQLGKVKAFEQAAEITPQQRELQARIAQVYESLPDNDLKNPNVRKAYQELAKEVIRQFNALPVKVEVLNGQGEPYANSAAMRRDILDNNHLFIFGTTPETFGPPGADFTGHPLLGETGLKDQNGYPLLYNDLLRAVHDYYAHAMAPTQFGPRGEEAAWKNHMSMTNNMWARWALTAETRGQNSWVNFREGAQDLPINEREFARQKAVLLPIEYSLTGDRTVDKPMKEFIAKLGEKVKQGTKPSMQGPKLSRQREAQDEYAEVERKYKGTPMWLKAPNGNDTNLSERQWVQVRTPSFKAWFGDWEKYASMQGGVFADDKGEVSKAVDANGEPLVVYHGAPVGGFSVFNTPGGTRRGDLGIFTTSNLEMAKSYRKGRAGEIEFENMDREELVPGDNVEAMSGYYPMFINLRNPQEANFEGAYWNGERPGQYVVLDENGDQLYTPEGKGYFDLSDDANTFARENGGTVEPAPDHYETTDSVVREARRYNNDGAIIRDVVDSGSNPNNAYIDEPSDVFVAFDPSQLKSATQNTGEFNPRSDDLRFSRQRIVGDSKRDYTPEQRAYFERVGRTVTEPTLKERVQELRKDLGKKLAQGIVDQFRPLRELSGKAYALARLSKGSAGAFEALLHHGKLSIKDGVYDGDQSGGFIERVGVPLQGELEDFLWWVAANRAERLMAEDRENLFTQADIDAGKSLDNGTTDYDYTLQHDTAGKKAGTVTRDRTLIYRDALKTFDEFNKNTLDMAEQSGLIDGDSRQFWENEFYVPFYRVSDEGGSFIGGGMKDGLVRQRAFKRLKGGNEKLNSDLLANTLSNWGHLIDAAAKNRAAKESLEAAQAIGIAIEADQETVRSMAKSMNKRGDVVWFMDQGKERYFLVDDPMVMTAITSLSYAGLRGPIMDALSAPKHWLTVGVTASPAFKIKNLIRDSMQAVATAPLSYNIGKNIAEGIKASDRKSQTYVSALASGGLIRFGTMLEGSQSKRVRQLVKMGTKESTILDSESKVQAMYDKYLEPAVMAYNELGNRGEEINRASLFKQLQDQGMDQATAALMARDLMDFSMQGSWTAVRFLTQVVPFMNARLQGLYKLGRAGAEDPKRFGVVLGAVALASVALMLAYQDDDDWKKREDWDRNNFWWFKLGGVAFRIPKPFEIGAIATLAERGLEYFTNPEMTGRRLGKNVKDIFLDSLSMNPVPQLTKPIVDIYSNKDSFSGRPIETMGMERLKSQYRYTANTSMLARGLSTATLGALSPVQYDHLIRGYFAWLGSMVVGATDMILRPLTGQPSRPTADYFKVATGGIVQELGSSGSRYVSQMYEQAERLEQAMGTYRMLMKTGRAEEAREFFKANKEDIVKYGQVEKVKAAETRYNELIRMIERSNLDPDVKKERIRDIQSKKDKVARVVAPGYKRQAVAAE